MRQARPAQTQSLHVPNRTARYDGNDLASVAQVAAIGAGLGLVVIAAGVIGITAEGRWDQARPEALPLADESRKAVTMADRLIV